MNNIKATRPCNTRDHPPTGPLPITCVALHTLVVTNHVAMHGLDFLLLLYLLLIFGLYIVRLEKGSGAACAGLHLGDMRLGDHVPPLLDGDCPSHMSGMGSRLGLWSTSAQGCRRFPPLLFYSFYGQWLLTCGSTSRCAWYLYLTLLQGGERR